MIITTASPLTTLPICLPLSFITTHSCPSPSAFLLSVPGKFFSPHPLISLAPFCIATSLTLWAQTSIPLESLSNPPPDQYRCLFYRPPEYP